MLSLFGALLLAGAPALATDTLKPGDPAPALSVETWLKGEPVAAFEKGKVYVVEFWATWCGPCIASMPHLSDLQAQYKEQGLTLIGLTSEDPRNPLDAARAMVEEKGDTMAYTVAWDRGRETNSAYMQAAGQNGIPCSFLIDKQGRIAYIGHPLWLDEPLAAVVAGTWKAEKDNELLEAAKKEFASLSRERDPKAALKSIQRFEREFPAYAARVEDLRFRHSLAAGKFDDASEVGARLVERHAQKKNAVGLNEIAWTIVDPKATWKKRDLELALRAASQANEILGDKDPAVLDTLARVHFLKGDAARAIELQRRAVELAEEGMKASLQKTLAEYEKKAS